MEPGAWIKHSVQDAGPWEIASVNVGESIGVDGDYLIRFVMYPDGTSQLGCLSWWEESLFDTG